MPAMKLFLKEIQEKKKRRNFFSPQLCWSLCGRWYPVILTLHRYFIAISRVVVDHVDGDGTSLVIADDVEVWPYSVGLLVNLKTFQGTLHWPVAEAELGGGGISFVEILILYELWAGERLELEKAVPRYRRPGRPISVSVVPFGPGTDIWRSCRFLGALF